MPRRDEVNIPMDNLSKGFDSPLTQYAYYMKHIILVILFIVMRYRGIKETKSGGSKERKESIFWVLLAILSTFVKNISNLK
jgi:uncharacterized membrane protein